MRDLVLIVASSSSIVIPPSSSPFPNPSHSHHSTKSKPKPSFTPSGKQSSQLGSSRSPAPLLSAARWDTTLRRRGRLKYYANLASKLAEQGRFHDFLMVAESVVGSGLEPARFVSLLNAELLSKGILLMLSEGNVSSIVEVMSGVKKLGIDRFELFDKEAIARECRRIVKSSGGLEEFVNLTEALAGIGFSINELVEPSEIVELCVNKRNPSAAVRYACTSSASQIIFCSVIHEFGKKRDLASALTVFEASKKEVDSPNLYAYRRMIDVCGVCGDYMKARSIYEELLNQKATPNVYVINSLMNVNSHDLSYTLHIYKQMQSLGVKADIATYNILLKSCCLVARVDLAKEIYREVQQLESKGALKLDAFTYSTIVKVFADAKMWATALEVKEDMAAAGVIPNHITWSSLINACASAGLVDQSLKLFDEMLNAGCQPNSQCCNTLLHACVESCQFDRAFRLFQSWKAIGFENENLNLKSNSNSNSLRFSMRTPFKPMVSTYNILMKACGTDYNRAKALMDEMKNIGLTPNIISWSILISICGRKGSVKGALKILKSMREAGIQPDVVAYTAAIKACVEGRNMKFAFSLFTEMKKNKVRPNLVTYNTLLRARSRYGSLQEVQQCLAIYQDMRKAGYRANDYYLKQLIEEWCEEVIQNNNQNKSHFTSSTRIEFSESRSLFLEKVAELLQKDHDECLLIDLQGLTKVEARIVVLAVLRMIKENYSPGYTIKEDMCIILDIPGTTAKHDSEIQDAITKLLQDELGLEVISSGPPLLSKKIDLEITQKSNLKISSRRPRVLQRLRITKESLYHWLQRRTQHHPLQG